MDPGWGSVWEMENNCREEVEINHRGRRWKGEREPNASMCLMLAVCCICFQRLHLFHRSQRAFITVIGAQGDM